MRKKRSVSNPKSKFSCTVLSKTSHLYWKLINMIWTFIRFRQNYIKITTSIKIFFSIAYMFNSKVVFHHWHSQQDNYCAQTWSRNRFHHRELGFTNVFVLLILKRNACADFPWTCWGMGIIFAFFWSLHKARLLQNSSQNSSFFAKFLCLVNKSPYARLHVCIIKILFAYTLFISSTQKLKSNKGEPQELSLTNVEKEYTSEYTEVASPLS